MIDDRIKEYQKTIEVLTKTKEELKLQLEEKKLLDEIEELKKRLKDPYIPPDIGDIPFPKPRPYIPWRPYDEDWVIHWWYKT